MYIVSVCVHVCFHMCVLHVLYPKYVYSTCTNLRVLIYMYMYSRVFRGVEGGGGP